MGVARVGGSVRGLWLALLGAVVVMGSGVFAFSSLGESVSFYISPSELIEINGVGGAGSVDKLRLGGVVILGSVEADGGGVVFEVGDFIEGGEGVASGGVSELYTQGGARVKVRYGGRLPDLFKEGGVVVAEGKLELSDGVFSATKLMAKHDENYVPPAMRRRGK